MYENDVKAYTTCLQKFCDYTGNLKGCEISGKLRFRKEALKGNFSIYGRVEKEIQKA